MKEIIIEKINKMEDLEQRKLLKNMMTGIFTNLVDYQEDMNNKLEKRVFDEIDNSDKKYYTYFTVVHRDKLDPLDNLMNPIFLEDAEEKKYDSTEIAKKINMGEKVKLATVFMKCSYIKIKEISKKNKVYKGYIITNKGQYDITLRLEHNTEYTMEIEKLHKCFNINNISWETVNSTYITKFFDVILINCSNIPEGEEIQEIKFSLEEYEEYRRNNSIPLWNIKRVEMKGAGFPIGAKDRSNYHNVISLKKEQADNGFIIDENEKLIRYIKNTEDEIDVISPVEKTGRWNVMEIIQPKGDDTQGYEYEVVSNSKKTGFLDDYRKKNSVVIRTKSEIKRIVNSFEISKNIELKDIEIRDVAREFPETYDMNYFIVDDIRMGNEKKVMSLKFSSRNTDDFISYDTMSFLVTEVQMFFPEYLCEGEFI